MQTSPAPPLPADTEAVTDAAITAAIEQFLLTKRGVSPRLMQVSTHEGIVALAGTAPNLLARERAEEIALAVRGVRGVVNEVLIRTRQVPDADLQHDAEQALAHDPATANFNLSCPAQAGTVAPTGVVQSWAERGLVLRVLQGVRGVQAIDLDALVLRGGGLLNSDEEITTQIRELLDWDIRVNSALVDIRTRDRAVHVTGLVGSAAEKAHVIATAYQAGAVRVDTHNLAVVYWAMNSQLRRDKFVQRPDEAIAEAVRDSLALDPRVQDFEPLVQVLNGTVTLAGTVSNLLARQSAEADARHVVGVGEVHNLLKVRPTGPPTDRDLHQAVTAALARDPYVGHLAFNLSVTDGTVHLAGHVHDYFEQEQAGAVAMAVRGVAEVENRVSVPGATGPNGLLTSSRRTTGPAQFTTDPDADADHALAERIRTRFFWSSLYNQNVEVQVEHGRVTLTGTVDTGPDRRQAAREAHEAGAGEVNNHLHISSAL